MQNLSISLLQIDLRWQDRAGNREHASAWLEKIPAGTHLVLLPEMFPTGFNMNSAECAEPAQGESVQWMQQMAKRHNCTIGGSVAVTEQGRYYNRFYAVNADGVMAQYDKRHLFRMAGEDKAFTAGEESVVFTLLGWRIRPFVCYDLRFPVWSRNKMMGDSLSTDLQVYVANWPEPRISHWKALLQARAIENQCCVAGVNRVGSDGNNFTFTGDSIITDHLGAVQATVHGTEAVISHTLDADALKVYRAKFPAWQDADAFSL